MRRSMCFLVVLLLACVWAESVFAATGHSAHGVDPNAFHLTLVAEPAAPRAGEQVVITLNLTDAYGAPVSEFETVHEKKLHLIIVRQGLDKFTHVHPEPGPQGAMTSAMTFPEGGTYYFYADFTPRDGSPVTIRAELNVDGPSSPAPPLNPYVPGVVQTDELLADVGVTSAQGQHRITFSLKDLNEAPVTDLEPYLGAMGHLVILSADGQSYVHAHPAEGGDPSSVAFDVIFPAPGIYKAWGEFQRGGKVLVVPVVMKVD